MVRSKSGRGIFMRREIDLECTKDFRNYSIGDMATMLSMTPPTIRFYDQEGIVVPKRNDENRYRQYTVVDGNYLLKTKELKNAGFSVQETEKMLNECSLHSFKEGLLVAEERLKKEVFRLSLYQAGVRKYYERCEKCSKNLSVSMEKRPEMYRYTHQVNDMYLEGEGREEALRAWTDYLPVTVFSFMFRQRDLLENIENADLHWGFSAESELAREMSLDEIPLSEYLPSCNSVYMVFCTKNEVFLKARYLRPAPDYMTAHNFHLCGDVIGNSLARVIGEDGSVLHFYEVWLPIQ